MSRRYVRAELSPTRTLQTAYFFLAFLAFFAFFAFFAFLAIVSSQGYNGLNATREACSAEGQPRNILAFNVQQIRSQLPCAVTPPSSRYPQLLYVRILVNVFPLRCAAGQLDISSVSSTASSLGGLTGVNIG